MYSLYVVAVFQKAILQFTAPLSTIEAKYMTTIEANKSNERNYFA